MHKEIMSSKLLSVFSLVVFWGITSFGGVPYVPVKIIGALDWEERGGNAEVVAGPWKKCGDVIVPDQPFECENTYTIDPEFIKLPCEEGAPWFYSVTTTAGEGKYNLILMDGKGKHPLSRNGEGDFTMEGLSEDLDPVQPQVFKLGESHYRMYFWALGHGPKIRMQVAESSDLYHWKLANNGRPVLCHLGDSTWGEGLSPARVCNDATTIYRYPDGSWEIFSAAIVPVKDPQSRYSDRSVSPGVVRIIMRWTSPDGLEFSEPEVVLTPDEQDSAATQCYYLSQVDLEPYTVGFFGNYNTQDLRWRMEAVMSRDHRHWTRPIRSQGLFEEDYKGAVAITDFSLEEDGSVSLYYGAVNFNHDYKTDSGEPPMAKICKAQVPRRKFFGRQLEPGVTLVSPIIRYTGKNPKIYVSEDTELTCEWQELFATTTQRVKVQLNGDIAEIRLSEIVRPTATGRLHITGNGVVYDAEY